jgi:RNA exonuclease 1
MTSPLIYLLTPNQMLDNDYTLPTYLKHTDVITIPGLDKTQHPPDIVEPLGDDTGLLISQAVAGSGKVGYDIVDLVPRLEQQSDETRTASWMETPKAEAAPEHGVYPILALDCEMVDHLCSRDGLG